jgi:hypothetical protein
VPAAVGHTIESALSVVGERKQQGTQEKYVVLIVLSWRSRIENL